MKTLHLTLRKKWFDMILSGEKKEEYREFKDYWIKRFGYMHETGENGYWNEEMQNLPDAIHFTNGYGKDKPNFTIEVNDWSLAKSKHPEWGGSETDIQFIFKLGNILTTGTGECSKNQYKPS